MALNRYMRMRYIIPEIQKVSAAMVLDIGCLDGHFTQYLEGRENSVFAIDIKDNNIKRMHPEVMFSIARGESLPFADNTFDFVFCSDVFEHIMDFEKIVPEIGRVLKPGKTCLISTVDGRWSSPLRVRAFFLKYLPVGFRKRLMGAFAAPDEELHRNFMGHVRFDITPDKLEEIFRRNKMTVVKKKTYCHMAGSLLMEIFFSFNESIRYITFPFLKLLLPLDRWFPFGRPWQYYFIFRKSEI